jgi:hypothetical protein
MDPLVEQEALIARMTAEGAPVEDIVSAVTRLRLRDGLVPGLAREMSALRRRLTEERETRLRPKAIVPDITRMLERLLADASQTGLGGVLSLLDAKDSFRMLEARDPLAFWKRVFVALFPEYEPIVRADEYTKKLCLWMHWAHAYVLRRLHSAEAWVDEYEVKEQDPVERHIDIGYVRWLGRRVPRREFCEQNGFAHGRLLAVYQAQQQDTPLEIATKTALREHQLSRVMRFNRRSNAYEFYLKGDIQNVEGASEHLYVLVQWASHDGRLNLRDFTTFNPDLLPRTAERVLTLGCEMCAQQPALKCSRCSQTFCSSGCGASHLAECADH